jgi:hypothetical protein
MMSGQKLPVEQEPPILDPLLDRRLGVDRIEPFPDAFLKPPQIPKDESALAAPDQRRVKDRGEREAFAEGTGSGALGLAGHRSCLA